MIPFLYVTILLWALLPSRYVAATLPVLWVTQNVCLAPNIALFSVGALQVTVVDLVLASLLLRCALGIVLKKEVVIDRSLYLAVVIFLVVNLLATLVAGMKFGASQLIRGLTTEARLASEMMLIPVMAHAITTLPQARRCVGILLAMVATLAVIQFINFFGASHGIIIGEVQGLERGEPRYFGPVGDSVGFVLLLGYAASLCFASATGTAAFLGGIVLTAGLGAIFATGLTTVLFLVFGAHSDEVRSFVRRRLWQLPLLLFAGIVGVSVFAKPLTQTLVDRLSSGNYNDSRQQRVASAGLAVAMIVDNPLLGVGYMGYEPALERYGGAKVFDLSHLDGGTANANNQFLEALADAGLLGLLAEGALIFAAARLLFRLGKRLDDPFLRSFFIAAFIWLLAQVFGNLAAAWLLPSSHVARILWVIMGLAVATQRLLLEGSLESAEEDAERTLPEGVPA